MTVEGTPTAARWSLAETHCVWCGKPRHAYSITAGSPMSTNGDLRISCCEADLVSLVAALRGQLEERDRELEAAEERNRTLQSRLNELLGHGGGGAVVTTPTNSGLQWDLYIGTPRRNLESEPPNPSSPSISVAAADHLAQVEAERDELALRLGLIKASFDVAIEHIDAFTRTVEAALNAPSPADELAPAASLEETEP